MPFEENPYFTGRTELLSDLRNTLAAGKGAALTQAIRGLGGVGKTQTAVKYAYTYRDRYDAVFWTAAETEQELRAGFAEIAKQLDLVAAKVSEQEVAVNAAKRWLEENGHWLLIFDNANTPGLLKPFRPRSDSGHILLTSRADNFDALGITRPLEVRPLTPPEAEAFFVARTRLDGNSAPEMAAAAKLASDLGFLPLALEQAAAYINQTGASFHAYGRSYETRRLKLLELGKLNDDVYPDSVATTWDLNFQEIRENHPASADLLRASAFLSPDSIPFALLTEGGAELGHGVAQSLHGVGDDPMLLNELLAPLKRYSLIGQEGDTYSVHRLVQVVQREELSAEQRVEWTQRVIRAVDRAFPVPEYNNWNLCDELLPHAMQCVHWIGEEGTHPELETAEAAHLLDGAGKYLFERAQYAKAEPLLERGLAIREALPDPNLADIAFSLNNVALLYESQARYADAEPLSVRALSLRETSLGPTDADTGKSLNNLANIYVDQGRYAEAEPLYERARAITEAALGPKHADTATSLNNLAGLYDSQGRYAEAEPLYERARAITEAALGPEHPHTALSLNNLAGLYKSQGRYAEAEPLLIRARAITEAALGPEHPDAALSIGGLAGLYDSQGRHAEAEPLLIRARAITEAALGPEHPSTAVRLSDLARHYYAVKQNGKAEAFILRALEVQKKALPTNHPDIATSLEGYAKILSSMGRTREARQKINQAKAISIRHRNESKPK